MKDDHKTREELIKELKLLRRRIDRMEASKTEPTRAEETLLESEKKYRTIFTISPEAIVLLDDNGTVLDVNGRVYDWLGYRPEDAIGKNIVELPYLPQESKVKAKELLTLRMAGKNVPPYELDFIAKNGKKRIGRITATPIRGKGGRIVQDLVMISDITRHKRADEIIKRKLKFEMVISNISSRFVGFSDIDDAINFSLAEVGRLSGASRSYLFLIREDRWTMGNTHEWCAEGVTTQKDTLQDLPCDLFPWWMKKLKKKEVIHIKDVSQLPNEAEAERKILQRQDIKSLIVLPIHIGDEPAGFIGLDNVVGTREWGEDELSLLRIASEIIGSALQHKRGEEALQRAHDELEERVGERTAELKKTVKILKKEVEERKLAEEKLRQATLDLRKLYKRLRELYQYLLAAREDERTGIARELHDELGQTLTALKMDLTWIGNHLDKDQKSLANKTQSTIQLIDSTIKMVQRLTSELRPGILDDLGLAAAVEWQAEEFQKRYGIPCLVTFEGKSLKSEGPSTALFRVFQEALTNIARHSQATHVNVHLKIGEKEATLKIEDNGRGITQREIHGKKSFGIISMRERIASLNGTFSISGRRGTRIEIVLPLEEKLNDKSSHR